MSITIRKANLNDAPAIAKIHVETWQSAYRGLVPDSFLDNLSVENRTKSWQESFSDPENKATVFVGYISNELLGWVSVGPNRDKDMNDKVGELWAIYIHPTAQHKGLGKALMSKGLNELKRRGYTHATLWVLDTNKAARDFYESQGWKVEGKTKLEPREGFDLNEVRYLSDL